MTMRRHRRTRLLQMKCLSRRPWYLRGLHRKTGHDAYCFIMFSDGTVQMVDL